MGQFFFGQKSQLVDETFQSMQTTLPNSAPCHKHLYSYFLTTHEGLIWAKEVLVADWLAGG